MIRIQNLTVRYGASATARAAVQDVSLTLDGGGACALIGPSGCGKSTLLKVLAGIITRFEGTATVNGRAICPKLLKIGFIPQNYGLLPWQDVAANIRLGVRIKRREDAAEKADALIRQLGLAGLERRYPAELSGGQRQRVALARAFLLEPDLLLMDEPFSALDAMTREEMQEVFLTVWKQNAVSTVLVTHHVEEAVYLGQKIAVMSAAPGRILRVIENPLAGAAGARGRNDFFVMSRRLREMIKEGWSA